MTSIRHQQVRNGSRRSSKDYRFLETSAGDLSTSNTEVLLSAVEIDEEMGEYCVSNGRSTVQCRSIDQRSDRAESVAMRCFVDFFGPFQCVSSLSRNDFEDTLVVLVEEIHFGRVQSQNADQFII